MTDQQPPVGNPGTAWGQAQTDDTNQGVFGWSPDVLKDPNIVQPVQTAESTPTENKGDDFEIHLDDLKIAQNEPVVEPKVEKEPIIDPIPEINLEPVIIEPEVAPEPEVAKPEPVKPEIIEQVAETKKIPTPPPVATPRPTAVVEPQMNAWAKVNPWNQSKNGAPRPQQAAPRPRPPVRKPVQEEKPAVQEVKVPEIQSETKKPVERAPVKAPTPRPEPKVEAKPIPRPEPKVEVKEEPKWSELKKKLDELITSTKNLQKLQKLGDDEVLEVLGANNDKLSVVYHFEASDNSISIEKTETDKVTEDENTDTLSFVYDTDTQSVQILLDEVLLFDEVEHLTDDLKKKMQVWEKLNKFIFLLGEQVKNFEKEAKEKEAEELERRRLQDIFRNF